jgi:hypothetical protein
MHLNTLKRLAEIMRPYNENFSTNFEIAMLPGG